VIVILFIGFALNVGRFVARAHLELLQQRPAVDTDLIACERGRRAVTHGRAGGQTHGCSRCGRNIDGVSVIAKRDGAYRPIVVARFVFAQCQGRVCEPGLRRVAQLLFVVAQFHQVVINRDRFGHGQRNGDQADQQHKHANQYEAATR